MQRKNHLFLIEVVSSEEPSHLDIVSRGGFDPRPIRGSITTRRVETETYPVDATSRDEAISIFRAVTGYSGQIERCVRSTDEAGDIDTFERDRRGLRFGRAFG